MQTDPIAEWLAALGTLSAAGMTAKDAQAKIAAYSPMLRGKYAPGAFTMDSLEAVASGLKFFPSYGELCDRLTAYWRENRPTPAGPAIAGPNTPGAGHWHGYIAGRLVAGGDRQHLLSLAKRYAEPAELEGIMRAFYSQEMASETAHASEVRRDKGRAAEDIAKAVAKSLSRPKLPRASTLPDAPPPKPPVDPHAPGRLLDQAELKARLIRLEREAASNDPPPNAQARIAQLRSRIEQERAA